MTLYSLLIVIASIIISSTAHVLLKKGVMTQATGPSSEALLSVLMHHLFNPWIFTGIFLHVVALIVWLWALRHVDITIAYPFLALGYVLVAFMAWLWLGETLTPMRIAGMVIIIIGLVVLSQGGGPNVIKEIQK
jgi:drug/metabolite transporter (DMT)-like permease